MKRNITKFSIHFENLNNILPVPSLFHSPTKALNTLTYPHTPYHSYHL